MVVSFAPCLIASDFTKVRSLQYDATAGVLGGGLAEVLQERAVRERLIHAALILDILGGELNDRARLDRARGCDVMAMPVAIGHNAWPL